MALSADWMRPWRCAHVMSEPALRQPELLGSLTRTGGVLHCDRPSFRAKAKGRSRGIVIVPTERLSTQMIAIPHAPRGHPRAFGAPLGMTALLSIDHPAHEVPRRPSSREPGAPSQSRTTEHTREFPCLRSTPPPHAPHSRLLAPTPSAIRTGGGGIRRPRSTPTISREMSS